MKRFSTLAFMSVIVACTPSLTKSGLDPQMFDAEYDGKKTELFTLTNRSGMEVCITNFGGRIVSVMVPGSDGEYRDVVLGFDNISSYFPENNKTDFGAAIGRYANRLNKGRITIEGVEYTLPVNNFGHCLHGGPDGWQYKVFEAVESDVSHVKLRLVSPDGDSGFPGKVTAFVTYTLTNDNGLDIKYEAETDAPTVINMTNHSYFNLSGKPESHSICDDNLYINASQFTPVDSTFMTTGEILPVDGTPMDFTTATLIGERIDDYEFVQLKNGLGYDHNWVLDTEGDTSIPAAGVVCFESGIIMSVYTDEPGIQVYTGNFLDGSVTGKNGVTYNRRAAICLETQKYPDTPNKPDWPSALLLPGQKYSSHTIFSFDTISSLSENESCGHSCNGCDHACGKK